MEARGREIRFEVIGIEKDILSDGNKMEALLREAAHVSGATPLIGINETLPSDKKPNSDPGCTATVLLDESHFWAHSFSDEGWAAFTLFTCGEKAKPYRAYVFILEALGINLDISLEGSGPRVTLYESSLRFVKP